MEQFWLFWIIAYGFLLGSWKQAITFKPGQPGHSFLYFQMRQKAKQSIRHYNKSKEKNIQVQNIDLLSNSGPQNAIH